MTVFGERPKYRPPGVFSVIGRDEVRVEMPRDLGMGRHTVVFAARLNQGEPSLTPLDVAILNAEPQCSADGKTVSVCAVIRFWDSRGSQSPRPLVRSGRKLSERRWR
jgi:hypothetical protein